MLAGRNQRVVMELIANLKGRDMGAQYGSNTGPNTVQHFPNGTFIDTDFPALGTYSFQAVLVNSGPPPSSNSDYTDARYFARPVILVQSPGADPADLPTLQIAPNGIWATATNAEEIAQGSHLLPVYSGDPTIALTGSNVTIVTVSMVEGVSAGVGNTIYAFNATPQSSISILITSDFAAGSQWGRYKAKSYGAGATATATTTTLGALAASEDVIFINGSEWGLATQNNLLLSANTSTFAQGPVSATVIGSCVISGVTYKIATASVEFSGCTSVTDPVDGGDA